MRDDTAAPTLARVDTNSMETLTAQIARSRDATGRGERSGDHERRRHAHRGTVHHRNPLRVGVALGVLAKRFGARWEAGT